MINLFSDITNLQQVGNKRGQLYKKIGIYTINDLLWHFPRSYINFNTTKSIGEFEQGARVTIKALVVNKKIMLSRRGFSIYSILASSSGENFVIKIFNSRYAYNLIEIGDEYVFVGRIAEISRRPELNLIHFTKYPPDIPMQPVYRLTYGLSSKMITQNVKEALTQIIDISDYIPSKIQKDQKLATLSQALVDIHFPPNEEALNRARKRLAMDELVVFNVGMNLQNMNRKTSNTLKIKPVVIKNLIAAAKFDPTNSQMRTIQEIVSDLQKGNIPSRLILGDVGCGKTFIAAATIFTVCKNGYQAAFMVPTEILAFQHHSYLTELFTKLGIRVAVLCSSTRPKEKRSLKEKLANHEIDCLIGTHAILSEAVCFANLGLVITDEQHKFGVKQQENLLSKGTNPYTLIMSATPIPRTFALMLYENLEVSIVDELPSNRIQIKSFFVNGSYHTRIFEFIKKEVAKGRQCFIVCPLIEKSDEDPESAPSDNFITDLKPVIQYTDELRNGVFHDYKVELMHGELKSSEKEEIMQKFKSGETQILITTTVIEVGIDIPNASIMLIENAERFGLAQLHQLRGRIGRGSNQSYCILVSDSGSRQAQERLKFIATHTSGFEIAEYDLKTRGPGEFLGTKQHGMWDFKLSKYIETSDWIIKAKQIAKNILKKDPTLKLKENSYLKNITED